MHEQPVDGWRLPITPADIPGLDAFWDFNAERPLSSSAGDALHFIPGHGQATIISDPQAPWGGSALRIDEGDHYLIPRNACPQLDYHGTAGHFTLIAWIRRRPTVHGGCEFIAGQWNETNRGRQYGLFLNIAVWRSHDQICGHLSHVGGPTPGYRYCMDGAIGQTPVPRDAWHCVAMTYDGQQGAVWLDGRLDLRPGINPYSFPGGLHDGGPNGSDFTLGAVDRSGEMGNFFAGDIAALGCYHRALSAAEIYALARANQP